MQMTENNLESNLEQIFIASCRNIDLSEIKKNFLDIIFYKYLSEKFLNYMDEELKDRNLTYLQAYEKEEYRKELKNKSLKKLGYFIEPKYLFNYLVEKTKNNEFIIHHLEDGFHEITSTSFNTKSQDAFLDLIKIDPNSINSRETLKEQNENISKIILKINNIDFRLKEDEKEIGNAFENLLQKISKSMGKMNADFNTPKDISILLSKIIASEKTNPKNVYDSTCGSGSLLLKTYHEANIDKIYGQELNQTIFNIARMNMIINGIDYDNFDIKYGDTLENPLHIDKKFDAIVSHIPFGTKWNPREEFYKDKRFKEYDYSIPKLKADYAFIQHMLYHLNESGIMSVLISEFSLVSGSRESKIREYLIKKDYVDSVIKLPNNILYGTGISPAIIIFKKNKSNQKEIQFIDASKDYKKERNKHKLREEDIEKIVNTYKNRIENEKYSRIVKMDEIIENDYSLKVSYYIDQYENRSRHHEHNAKLEKIAEKVKTNKEIKKYCYSRNRIINE